MIENIFENNFFRYIKLSKQFSVDLKINFFFLRIKKNCYSQKNSLF